MPHNGTCGDTCRLVSLEGTQCLHVRRRRLVAQRQAGDDGLPRAGTWDGENALRVRMVVCGVYACRAAADDLNTALGGDLKLTDFGPRLPQLLRDAELGHFRARRGRGEVVHTVTISWLSSRSGDEPVHSIFCRCVVASAPSESDCEVFPRLSLCATIAKLRKKPPAEATDRQTGKGCEGRGRLYRKK